jgi:hypothetical protein
LERRVFKFLATAVATAAGLSGIVACSSSPVGGGTDGYPTKSLIVIRGADGTFASVFPADLKLGLGATPILQLGVEGVANGRYWSMIAWLPVNQATTGKVNVALSDGPIANRVAELYLQSSNGKVLTTATSGVFRASIARGRITGEVQATPGTLSADIEGNVLVSCWIPQSDSVNDDDAGGITGAGPGSQILVEDKPFSSKQCAPFKGLR